MINTMTKTVIENRSQPGGFSQTFQAEDRVLDALVIHTLPYNPQTQKLKVETQLQL